MTVVFDANKPPQHGASERSRFARRVSALFLVIGLILSAIAFQVYRVVGDFLEASHWVTHSMSVRQE
ncbi:MAG: hypothetical protein ABI866_01645, partial [Dokdonella sp.]